MDIFDKNLALEQAGGSGDLARDLFGMLINELPTLKSRLETSYTGSANQEFWDAAHKIHGSTAYCGVPALKQASKQLEDAIKAQNDTHIAQTFAEVCSAIDTLLANAQPCLQQLEA